MPGLTMQHNLSQAWVRLVSAWPWRSRYLPNMYGGWLSCEVAFEEERPLWIRADFHRSEELSVLQRVPVVDYPEDTREDRYGDGVSESCPGVGPV